MTALYEVWKQEYDSYSNGEWYHDCSTVHKEVAQAIVDSCGWGTHAEIRGEDAVTVPIYEEDLDTVLKDQIIVHGHLKPRDQASDYELRQEQFEIKRVKGQNKW